MPRFMVVDDSRAILSIICRAITAGGYQKDSVCAVSSGAEALEKVDALRPDLIITDWHMPGMSGLELVRALRQSGRRGIKIGMVTTEMSEVRIAEARENGIEFILHKPFKDGDLLAAIEKCVGSPSASGRCDVVAPAVSERPLMESLDAVSRVVSASLPATHFTLEKSEPLQLDPLQPKVLVGLYSRMEQKSVDALCTMEMACAGLIGASILGYDPVEMRSAMSSETGREVIVQALSPFLKGVAILFGGGHKAAHRLVRSNVLPFDTAPLIKGLQHNAGLETWELRIQGFGQGRFVLLKFAT